MKKEEVIKRLVKLQKTITPDGGLKSGKTLIILSLYCGALALVTEGISEYILAVSGLIFIIRGMWLLTKEKQWSFLGIKWENWAISVLICVLLSTIMTLMMGGVTNWVWVSCPPLAAAIAFRSELFEKSKFKIPPPEVRQKILLIFLIYLVMSCWIQFGFTIDGWLEENPSLREQDFSQSSFVVKIDLKEVKIGDWKWRLPSKEDNY